MSIDCFILITLMLLWSCGDKSEKGLEEFADVITCLKTKREVEKRYLEILSRAKTISEILEVEEKLRIIREAIEAKELPKILLSRL